MAGLATILRGITAEDYRARGAAARRFASEAFALDRNVARVAERLLKD
jgi:hypothetical protein